MTTEELIAKYTKEISYHNWESTLTTDTDTCLWHKEKAHKLKKLLNILLEMEAS
jgi:hypothetical protein